MTRSLSRLAVMALLVLTVLSVLALPASAHVTLRTDNPSADGYAVYTVRIPNESDEVGTTTVEVQIPEELAASRYEPIPGWDIVVADGVLTLSGSVIEPGQFLDVRFQGKNPSEPMVLTFPSLQTYEDGEVVEWTGAPDSDRPAPTVETVASTGDAHGGHPATTDDTASEEPMGGATEDGVTGAAADLEEAEPVTATTDDGDAMSMVALGAGVLGLGLGGAAFARSGRRA